MLARLKTLAGQHESFAFETTLASKSFAPWLSTLRQRGYAVHVVFLWLTLSGLALERVAQRVTLGGPSVPAEAVERRYRAGLATPAARGLPRMDARRLERVAPILRLGQRARPHRSHPLQDASLFLFGQRGFAARPMHFGGHPA
jgi:predicted ABC-type ATPase